MSRDALNDDWLPMHEAYKWLVATGGDKEFGAAEWSEITSETDSLTT